MEVEETKLCLFSDKYSHDEYDRQPLPVDIFNSEGTLLAYKGQKLSKDRLKNVYVIIREVTTLQPGQQPKQSVEKKSVFFPASNAYEDEKTEVITNRLEQITFEPFPKIKLELRTNVGQIKDIYQKSIIDNVVKLDTKNNEKISLHIADYLDNILDNSLYAADYIDMINAIRSKDNYLTFSHACAVCFYSIAIAKKLQMLRHDLANRNGISKWRAIKTNKNKEVATYNFSTQLLKSIDYQKQNIIAKYTPAVRETLFERVHDLMHQYGRINFETNHSSFAINYDKKDRILIGVAALNHDLGKLLIENSIINKPDSLTDEEFDVIKAHPINSVKRLKEINMSNPRVLGAILFHHHLSKDIGYPKTDKPSPIEAQIIAIADVYDAMRSFRHFRNARSQREAIIEITRLYEAGCFDAPLYTAAVHTFEEYNHEFVTERCKKSADLEK